MYLSGRPLLDNAADQALFVGRDELLRKIDRSLRSGLNCLVFGDPGSGKTSLVRALMFRTRDSAAPLQVRYVRANAARTAVDLLTAILTVARLDSTGPVDSTGPGGGRLSSQELLDLLVRETAQSDEMASGTSVIVVEDVSADAGSELFGALRDELWQVDAQWLVTTSSVQAPGLLRPPADVFFETRCELGRLTVDEAAELLRRRLDKPESTGLTGLLEAADSARESPRRLLELARELSGEPAVGGLRLTTVAGLTARSQALEQVSRPARMLATELEAVGWASASDERLLDRMGWTRPRVVQVIAELESRGLVQMREENTGRGRPRKLYRLIPASQFVGTSAPGPDSGTEPATRKTLGTERT
jgi:energy-coupling factor transporter ATP-binding protein EcfA2